MNFVNGIISWNVANIHGLLGNKVEDPDFVKIISPNDIICLQETGCEVSLKGYKSYSDIRKSGKGGGVTTLVRNTILEYCSLEKCTLTADQSMNIVIVKVTDPNTNINTFVLNSYIPPTNSKLKNRTNCSDANFDALQEKISNILDNSSNELVLLGDLNARIGASPEFQIYDRAEEFELFPDTGRPSDFMVIPDVAPISQNRNSQDKITNRHKNLLLDLCGSQNLLILNGRTIGDSAGKYTCFKWNGNSVVDYFIASTSFLHRVKSLSVGEHTLFSDHNPVLLSLWHRNEAPQRNSRAPNSNYQEAPFRYRITENSLTNFTHSFEQPEFIQRISQLTSDAESAPKTHEAVEALNRDITKLINDAAKNELDISKQTQNPKPKFDSWFDGKCHTARRLFKRSIKIVDNNPDNQRIKARHRANSRGYRKIINKKRDDFFNSLNKKIKNGKTISWRDFKKLKSYKKEEVQTDSEQLKTFHQFYAKLYSDNHPTVDTLTKRALLEEANALAEGSAPNESLNSAFTLDELNAALGKLKSGKASAFDHISNEMLRGLNLKMRSLLLKLFNLCLETGIYLWSKSVITPIHKKGCTRNPDNYRAIAVCSCIGKLLSTMLLSRLVTHRQISHPDPPNQAGFTKGSQCNDHIFTLMSTIEKYKKVKCKIYAVFIDLRKAFDLVCRQALMFKLACYGVNGGFYDIIKDMYSKSEGHIKMNGKISEAFKILKGTEQGHPLSPEFFKVYFKKLSDLLNEAVANCPTLAGISVSHLAWADDLVILALDPDSLQKLLSIIGDYCNEWGLEINISKTKFMVFNGKGPDIPNWRPSIHDRDIEMVSSYCYLGIIISSTGKFRQANDSLYRKGLGAYFSLRSTIDRRYIDASCLHKLFNTLVKPILLYGCQVWAPVLPTVSKVLSCFSKFHNLDHAVSHIAKQQLEQVHLRHLKYLLGINRRAVNATAWGETGSYPIIIEMLKLSTKYFKRVMSLPSTQLVKAAMTEQINLKLSWFVGIESVIKSFNNINLPDRNSSSLLNATFLADSCTPELMTENLRKLFRDSWGSLVKDSRKLSFYSEVKKEFEWEPYLNHARSFQDRRATTQIRSSSHHLRIERGRYDKTPLDERTCNYCELNTNQLIIEDENHMLHSCPLGKVPRDRFQNLSGNLLSIVGNGSFNLASTFISHPDCMDNLSEDDVSLIKLSTSTINKIYRLTLNFKDSLQVDN